MTNIKKNYLTSLVWYDLWATIDAIKTQKYKFNTLFLIKNQFFNSIINFQEIVKGSKCAISSIM